MSPPGVPHTAVRYSHVPTSISDQPLAVRCRTRPDSPTAQRFVADVPHNDVSFSHTGVCSARQLVPSKCSTEPVPPTAQTSLAPKLDAALRSKPFGSGCSHSQCALPQTRVVPG